jgi:hypothetical protein
MRDQSPPPESRTTSLIPANRRSLIPATTRQGPLIPPPPPKQRHIPAWIMQLVLLGVAGVIVVAVLVTVAKSAPNVGEGNTSPQTFGAITALTQTYSAHCDGGDPYAVRDGDTLASIAQHLGVALVDLAKVNGLKTNAPLVTGQIICPPGDHVSAPIIVGTTSIEPCQSTNYWLPVISQWATPPGCYALVYSPDPSKYPVRPAWGWCNWWPEEAHPNLQGDAALFLPGHSTPRVGATVWFDPGVQGAGPIGHYAELVAVHPDGYWLLISEMNDSWRGAGWGRVNYRYIHVGAGIQFRY